MPRRFSSFSRSVSMPVRALTSAVLPWSMWPAVPAMTLFILCCGLVFPVWNLRGQESSNVTFKSGVSNVRIDVQVTGPSGELITGLTQADLAVFDEGKKVPL